MNRWDFENLKQQTARSLIGQVQQQKTAAIAAEDRARNIERQNTADTRAGELFDQQKTQWPMQTKTNALQLGTAEESAYQKMIADSPTLDDYNQKSAFAKSQGLPTEVFREFKTPQEYKTFRETLLYEKSDRATAAAERLRRITAGSSTGGLRSVIGQTEDGTPVFGVQDLHTGKIIAPENPIKPLPKPNQGEFTDAKILAARKRMSAFEANQNPLNSNFFKRPNGAQDSVIYNQDKEYLKRYEESKAGNITETSEQKPVYDFSKGLPSAGITNEQNIINEFNRKYPAEKFKGKSAGGGKYYSDGTQWKTNPLWKPTQ